jgi:signal transduction histidine kinase
LDAGRLSFGKLRLRKSTVELTPLIAQAIEACQSEIEHRQHRLDVDLAPLPVFLDADATRVVQLISNLVSNACKYMGNGGVIEVVTRVDGQNAVLRVRDQGIGIDPDVMSRVFEPYVQVGVGPLHTQGLGIGLALVKSIAEAHGGTVEARSEGLDRGSEFIVKLPVASSGDATCSMPQH